MLATFSGFLTAILSLNTGPKILLYGMLKDSIKTNRLILMVEGYSRWWENASNFSCPVQVIN